MTTLPLTVLVYEGPIARAYLAVLRYAGYRPERIIALPRRRKTARQKTWLPRLLVDAHRLRRAVDQGLHWPRWLRRYESDLYREMVEKVGAAFGLPQEVFGEALDGPELASDAANVECIAVESLKDRALSQRLSALPPGEILYSGGGIVPPALLNDPVRPFLHVHPGFLPHVRGADGLLWSLLVRQRLGASCFHMTAGIDLGPVLAAREFAPLTFAFPRRTTVDEAMLHRALFSFYDPYLRAKTLIDHLRSRPAGGAWPTAVPQDPALGTTYHFMHPALRHRVLRLLFKDSHEASAR